MATKTFYVVRDMKHPLYRSRMLRAGDALELNGPDSRLYRQLGVITEQRPRQAAPASAPAKAPEPAKAPAAPKKAPAKRKARAKKKAAPKA